MINEKAISYRRTSELKELYHYRKKHAGERACTIWQSNNDKRFVYYSKYFNINKQYRTFMFIVTELVQFDLTKPIYVRFDDGLMFKSNAVSFMQECLTLQMPEEFMAYEYRKFSRKRFRPSDSEYANIVLHSDIVQSATQELSFQIIDYSRSGIALNLSDIHLKKFIESKKLVLKKLFMVSLSNEVELEMVYRKKIKYKLDGDLYSTNRVGFKLDGLLEEYLLKLHPNI